MHGRRLNTGLAALVQTVAASGLLTAARLLTGAGVLCARAGAALDPSERLLAELRREGRVYE